MDALVGKDASQKASDCKNRDTPARHARDAMSVVEEVAKGEASDEGHRMQAGGHKAF